MTRSELSAATRMRVLVLEGLRQDRDFAAIGRIAGITADSVRRVRDEVLIAAILGAVGMEMQELAENAEAPCAPSPPAAPDEPLADMDERAARILALVREGKSDIAIAREIGGLTASAIYQRRKKWKAKGVL